MKIEAFIPNWNSPKTDAIGLHQVLSKFCPAVVLESYDVPFAQQWEEAIKLFTGDIFLWAMADVTTNSLPLMFGSMQLAFNRGDIAMYAPNIDWTSQIYKVSKLPWVENKLYEVCGTDLLFCALTRELLEALPPLGCNSHAWSYDYLMTVVAHKMGKKVVRDYGLLFEHPEGSIYSKPQALIEQQAWMNGLPRDLQRGILEQRELQARLCA